jgi:hypothetical protein
MDMDHHQTGTVPFCEAEVQLHVLSWDCASLTGALASSLLFWTWVNLPRDKVKDKGLSSTRLQPNLDDWTNTSREEESDFVKERNLNLI